MNCGNCHHFRVHDSEQIGFCVRFPPTIHDQETNLCFYPRLYRSTVACGEYQEIRKAAEPISQAEMNEIIDGMYGKQ
jgi:hypothetical protein